jgi:hypothetical protein
MGREVRLVPHNWQHPTYGEHAKNNKSIYYMRAATESRNRQKDSYIPLDDKNYHVAATEWIEGFIDWHVNGNKDSNLSENYWEYAGNPPSEDFYVPYKKEDATWYQLYETVSEGTPVSPPFATKEGLIEYLCTKGDFWQQTAPEKFGDVFTPYSIEAAEYLVNGGYSPSLIITKTEWEEIA